MLTTILLVKWQMFFKMLKRRIGHLRRHLYNQFPRQPKRRAKRQRRPAKNHRHQLSSALSRSHLARHRRKLPTLQPLRQQSRRPRRQLLQRHFLAQQRRPRHWHRGRLAHIHADAWLAPSRCLSTVRHGRPCGCRAIAIGGIPSLFHWSSVWPSTRKSSTIGQVFWSAIFRSRGEGRC